MTLPPDLRGRVPAAWLLFAAVLTGCRPPSLRAADGRADGPAVYARYCVGCHGKDGRRGTGEMVLKRDQPRPRAELRAVIARGRGRGMPAWERPKGPLQADEVDAVLQHVERLVR
jgi:mono/diheme cytochrome c family protein